MPVMLHVKVASSYSLLDEKQSAKATNILKLAEFVNGLFVFGWFNNCRCLTTCKVD